MPLKSKIDSEMIDILEGAVKALESIGARSAKAQIYLATMKISIALNAGVNAAFQDCGLQIEPIEAVMKNVSFDVSALKQYSRKSP